MIVVDDMCMESYPCKHMITIDGVRTMMNGISIYELFKTNNLDIPEHFREYSPKPMIVIDDMCMESYPCKHMITIDGVRTMMNGVSIYKLLCEHNMNIPKHFSKYSSF